MSRYIDADKLHDEIYELTKFKRDPVTGDAVMRLSMKISEVLRQIDEQPSADVVEVVRCKDCRYRQPVDNCMYGECIFAASMVADDDYCSNGERKEQDDECK